MHVGAVDDVGYPHNGSAVHSRRFDLMKTTVGRPTAVPGLPAIRVFVLETNGSAILAFEATTLREAMELSRETWLRDELTRLTSSHAPLWDSQAAIKTRTATPEESESYRLGAAAENDDGDLPIVYLVKLDPTLAPGGATKRGAFPPRR